MPAISDRMPPVAVEFDRAGRRVTKPFDDPYAARQFYVQLDKAGRRPAVINPNHAKETSAMATKTKNQPSEARLAHATECGCCRPAADSGSHRNATGCV
jgi:hypothetical protein